MNDEIKLDTGPKELSDAAQSITEKIVSELKDAGSRADAAEPRLFFPEGIELISVVVKVGPADVEVTIAGAKGVKGAALRASDLEKDGGSRLASYYRDAAATNDTDPVAKGQDFLWFNNKNHGIRIDFGANGSPLENNDDHFIVPPGTYPSKIRANANLPNYPYRNTRVAIEGEDILGMPRIIIQ